MPAPKLRMLVSAAAMALGAGFVLSGPAGADPADLEGTWTGGGSVTFASGAREKARCRARFTQMSPTSYRVSGSCATQSGKVTQSAEVFKMTADRYRGNFHNPEFDVSGTISIHLHDRSMTATLTSSSGTGVLVMKR